MLVLLVVLRAVARENIDAPDAFDKRENLVVDSLVERIVMQCEGCKSDRKKAHKRPRDLYKLPSSVVEDPAFRSQAPILICEICDGATLVNALNTHDQRTNK